MFSPFLPSNFTSNFRLFRLFKYKIATFFSKVGKQISIRMDIQEYGEDKPLQPKAHCIEVFSVELKPSRDCFLMWVWKILFLLVDLANIALLLLLVFEGKSHLDHTSSIRNLIITISLLVTYILILEVATLFGMAKWIVKRFDPSKKWIPMWILFFVLLVVPVIFIFTICLQSLIILSDEGVLLNDVLYYGGGGYLLAAMYLFLMLFYPTAIIRPGRYSAFYGLNICCGFKKERERHGDYGLGLLIASEGEVGRCGCKHHSFLFPNLIFVVNMTYRLAILALGASLYFYVKYYY